MSIESSRTGQQPTCSLLLCLTSSFSRARVQRRAVWGARGQGGDPPDPGLHRLLPPAGVVHRDLKPEVRRPTPCPGRCTHGKSMGTPARGSSEVLCLSLLCPHWPLTQALALAELCGCSCCPLAVAELSVQEHWRRVPPLPSHRLWALGLRQARYRHRGKEKKKKLFGGQRFSD